MTPEVDRWIADQFRVSAVGMMRSVSPTGLVKARPGLGQTIRPSRGAIIATPVLGDYDPDPDYFFHWLRDSALVVDAMRFVAARDPEVRAHVADFVDFSAALGRLDGRQLVADPTWRRGVAPAFAQYVRSDEDLAGTHGLSVSGETRFNPDGTLDITRWGRPQNDGPALRALALLRWTADIRDLDDGLRDAITALVRADIAFTLEHWREPCLDIWEEELGRHYYTLRVQAAALDAAAASMETVSDRELAATCRSTSAAILDELDGYWRPDDGFYSSRVLASGERSTKELDMAVILATIHAGGLGPTHSVRDGRMQATLARLDEVFAADYAINRSRRAGFGPAMGRYRGDVYVSGGAWYITTLGATEFCFRAAMTCADRGRASGWVGRGDAYLATVQAYTPVSGELSEQFDQTTGEQTSAKHLAWSYAAFLTCAAARRAAIGS